MISWGLAIIAAGLLAADGVGLEYGIAPEGSMGAQSVDSSAIDRFVERWIEYCAGGLAVSLVYLGDRLGLFTTPRDAGPRHPQGRLAARLATSRSVATLWAYR